MEIGTISNYYEKIGVASVKLSSNLNVGDKIKVKGSNTEFEQLVESMQLNHEPIKKAKKGQEIGIKLKQPVKDGFKVLK